jgi:hypothetical protein
MTAKLNSVARALPLSSLTIGVGRELSGSGAILLRNLPAHASRTLSWTHGGVLWLLSTDCGSRTPRGGGQMLQPDPMEATKQAASAFGERLASIRARLTPANGRPWYPHRSIGNVWWFDQVLTGRHRLLFCDLDGKAVADIGAADGFASPGSDVLQWIGLSASAPATLATGQAAK